MPRITFPNSRSNQNNLAVLSVSESYAVEDSGSILISNVIRRCPGTASVHEFTLDNIGLD